MPHMASFFIKRLQIAQFTTFLKKSRYGPGSLYSEPYFCNPRLSDRLQKSGPVYISLLRRLHQNINCGRPWYSYSDILMF